VVLAAFREVEDALTNEQALAQRLIYDQQALAQRTEAVRIGTLKYQAGSIDLLSVLILQADQLASEATVIEVRTAQRTNRIQLHLALGGGFDATPAAAVLAAPVAHATATPPAGGQ
jgi:outer membrane protein TolC